MFWQMTVCASVSSLYDSGDFSSFMIDEKHPADGEALKDFDSLNPDFASDARNLITMDCVKSEYIMLSMIILGLSSPGNDIDMYLQPLIAELNELWEVGMETYDIVTNQTFMMRAAVLWTISDFPALVMLSEWSTKGKWACPTCNHNTYSQYLKHSHKMCYLSHRAFLPHDHPYRREKSPLMRRKGYFLVL
ncbi:hypothetical protein RDI58_007415 [Solanum bulbocastanum]|uniref:Uncharacterized protein n=1 Tax=Solanum bulbocastanum TaxID=147425 RepID=A0AAN8YIV3_SOLBU